MRCEARRQAVHLGVRPLSVPGEDCRLQWCLGGFLGNHIVYAGLSCLQLPRVPLFDLRLVFLREDIQFAQGPVDGRALELLDQGPQLPQEPGHLAGVDHAGVVAREEQGQVLRHLAVEQKCTIRVGRESIGARDSPEETGARPP